MAIDNLPLNLGKSALVEPPSQSFADAIEKKFARLRDEWRATRKPESSSIKLAMHPAYLKIIGMGPNVVPLLLRELANHEPQSWFLALMAITEADPVAPEQRGDGEAMAQAWLQWGKEQGYQW